MTTIPPAVEPAVDELVDFDPTPIPESVCTLDLGRVLYSGEACPSCGHTSTAHPGECNPALFECILCRVSVSVAQLRDVVASTASLAFRLEGRVSVLEEVAP